MREIKLVPNARYVDDTIFNRDLLGGAALAFRQGELDGACGPYAVMTALVSAGTINRQRAIAAWAESPDGRTKFAKALKNIKPLVQDGTDSGQLVDLIRGIEKFVNYKNTLKPNVQSTHGKALIPIVISCIKDNKMPVILRLDWQGSGAHWVVAIGYEGNEGGDIKHILVIDPGFDISRIQLWNGVLSCYVAKPGPKPYHYWVGHQNDNDSFCQIKEAVMLI